MTLDQLKKGEKGRITATGGEGSHRQHFLDMGLIPGALVTLVKFAPMGDPIEVRIHDYELTLRVDDAKKIGIEPVGETDDDTSYKNIVRGAYKPIGRKHPGYGEEGIFHTSQEERPIPRGQTITFALAGNQNCGKTTLFNQLTGSNQHVGNFPGVTVDKKSGPIKGRPDTLVTDLPGIYSLSPYSAEEIVSRRFILEEKPAGIINIADATNIERNLYLTLQLIELNVPMVLALNMMDEVRNNGTAVYINIMEEMLGIPVVPISAAKNEGVEELVKHAVHVAKYRERPSIQDFCTSDGKNAAVHRAIEGIMNLVDDHAKAVGLPPRFAATRLAAGDGVILDSLNLSENEKEMIEHILVQMEAERGLDRAAAIADMRFSFIEELCRRAVSKRRGESKEHTRSRRIDKVLTGKFTAIPSFIAIMAAIFYLTFNVIGAYLQEGLEFLIGELTGVVDVFLENLGVNAAVHSLVVDAIFGGVGSVLSFVPVIIVLFFFLSLLEDSGYMARIAFVMDKPLRKIGLSGRSIVPMLIGFGCTVPGVMASRTLPSARDRKMTILLTPFMSCTAKLPIYGFFASLFFPDHAGLVMIGLYILGIIMGIAVALISKKTAFKGEAVPFVMELPNYRMPGVKNVARLLWDKTKDFIQRAFTVIFLASVAVWFLQSFDFRMNLAEDSSKSILATVSGLIAPIFIPMGLGDWRVVTALVAGFMAKESVVSTLTVLYGTGETLLGVMSVPSAAALLVFCLLYTPCVAAVAAIKRELGGKWAWGIAGLQCLIAYAASFAVYFIANLIF